MYRLNNMYIYIYIILHVKPFENHCIESHSDLHFIKYGFSEDKLHLE